MTKRQLNTSIIIFILYNYILNLGASTTDRNEKKCTNNYINYISTMVVGDVTSQCDSPVTLVRSNELQFI